MPNLLLMASTTVLLAIRDASLVRMKGPNAQFAILLGIIGYLILLLKIVPASIDTMKILHSSPVQTHFYILDLPASDANILVQPVQLPPHVPLVLQPWEEHSTPHLDCVHATPQHMMTAPIKTAYLVPLTALLALLSPSA